MINITQMVRDLKILGYSQNSANILVGQNMSNGTLELLEDFIKLELKELAEKRYAYVPTI